MFYTCVFTVISLIYGLNLYKSHFPNEYNIIITKILTNIQQNDKLKPYLPFLTTICYNIIYIYSWYQVTLNKTKQFIGPYLQKGVKIFHSRFICDINVNTTKTFTNIYTNLDTNLIVIKSPAPKNDIIILDKVPENLDNITYETYNPNFLSLYLKTTTNDNKDVNYNIELCSDAINFCVVGNVFNINFFKYYLENVLNVIIDKDNNDPFIYTLELMDNNVSMVYLNETQCIVINKDGYEILGSSLKNEAKNEKIEDSPKLDASTICY
jgi:hypothetical protein